jgi:integral membrane sensor domain MASE1
LDSGLEVFIHVLMARFIEGVLGESLLVWFNILKENYIETIPIHIVSTSSCSPM